MEVLISETEAQDDKIEQLVAEIDRFLATISNRELVGAGEVVDFALDLRRIINPV
jgi:Na+/phosphate symporter